MAVFRRHKGNLHVEQDLNLVGVATGTVTVFACRFVLEGTVMKDLIVHADGTAVVRGAVLGDLVVKSGGSAIIHGDVMGVVLNEGGEVEIVKPALSR